MDAVIATNTTIDHSSVQGLPNWNETGGLSGRPLMARSTECLAMITDHLKGKLPVIASGGMHTLDDVRALLQVEKDGVMGAVLGRSLYEGTIDFAEAQKLVGVE